MTIFFWKKGIRSIWENEILTIGQGKTRGGAIFVTGKKSFEITKKSFILNHVQMDGGGIYLLDCHYVIIRNCLFLMNFAKWGGAIYLEKCSHIEISSCLFLMNCVKRDGGAISLSYCEKVRFHNNVFALNKGLRSSNHIDLHNSRQIIGIDNIK